MVRDGIAFDLRYRNAVDRNLDRSPQELPLAIESHDATSRNYEAILICCNEKVEVAVERIDKPSQRAKIDAIDGTSPSDEQKFVPNSNVLESKAFGVCKEDVASQPFAVMLNEYVSV